MKKFWDDYVDRSEAIAHGIRGKDYNEFQNMASHALAYGISLPAKGFDYLLDKYVAKKEPKRGAAVPSPSIKENFEPMPKGKKGKNIKKEIKQEVKKDLAKLTGMKAVRMRQFMNRPAKFRIPQFSRPPRNFGTRRTREKYFKAPVAVGRSGQTGARVIFLPSKKPGCIKMKTEIWMANVGIYSAPSSGPVFPVFDHQGVANSNFMDQNLYLCPQNIWVFPSMIQTLTKMFERFRIKCRLHYKSFSSTATNGSIKFAYVDDPGSLYASLGKAGIYPANGTSGVVYPGILTNMAKVAEGNLWKDFSTHWNWWQKGQDMCYVSANSYSGQIDAGLLEWNDLRESCQGLWVIYGQGFTPDTTPYQAYGEVWMEMIIELCEMMPQIMSATDPATSKHFCKECQSFVRPVREKKESKSEKFKDEKQKEEVQEVKDQIASLRAFVKEHYEYDGLAPPALRREVPSDYLARFPRRVTDEQKAQTRSSSREKVRREERELDRSVLDSDLHLKTSG